jgi:hypothetical protein
MLTLLFIILLSADSAIIFCDLKIRKNQSMTYFAMVHVLVKSEKPASLFQAKLYFSVKTFPRRQDGEIFSLIFIFACNSRQVSLVQAEGVAYWWGEGVAYWWEEGVGRDGSFFWGGGGYTPVTKTWQ